MNTSLNSTQLAAIRDAVNSGDTLAAIKLYREYTNTGLAEAKEAVEEFAQTGSFPTTPPASTTNFAEDVRQALLAGNKIEAIKRHREHYPKLGLAEAKEAVEKLEAELRVQFPDKFTKPAGKGCAAVFMFMFCLIIGIVVVWGK